MGYLATWFSRHHSRRKCLMKKVKIIAQNLPEDFGFLVNQKFVKITDLTVEQAELIQSQHPGYVEVITLQTAHPKRRNAKNSIK